MLTEIQVKDARKPLNEFESLPIGAMFTEGDDGDYVYIKTRVFVVIGEEEINEDNIVSQIDKDESYNAIDLRGEPYWFDYDNPITPIKNITIELM